MLCHINSPPCDTKHTTEERRSPRRNENSLADFVQQWHSRLNKFSFNLVDASLNFHNQFRHDFTEYNFILKTNAEDIIKKIQDTLQVIRKIFCCPARNQQRIFQRGRRSFAKKIFIQTGLSSKFFQENEHPFVKYIFAERDLLAIPLQ